MQRGNSRRSAAAAHRRDFLKAGSLAAASAVALWATAGCGAAGATDLELEERTLDAIAGQMKSGKLTARQLAEAYLARIDAIDRKGPALGSVIEINPDALSLADALDRERKAKGPRGPLHGVPILIKDNIATADHMETTTGSLALVGARPAADAFVAARLRKAGALLLGKTNMSEWANARDSNSISGWSGRGGQTKNPYALDRNPSGSSSGSAVAASANLCACAVGTETDGSITSPASINGIVGIKPTIGLVSRSGIIPISQSQDTAGPMARTVRDAAILLGALTGVDPDDAATADSVGRVSSDYAHGLSAEGLKGAKIGVVRRFCTFHEAVAVAMDKAFDHLQAAGATLIDVELPPHDQFAEAESIVFRYEMKAGVNAYLARLSGNSPIHNVRDVIDFNNAQAEKEMPYFGQDFLVQVEAAGGLESFEYQEARAKCLRITRTEGIDAAMEKNELEAIVAPTCGVGWVNDPVTGDRYTGGDIISLAAVAGYPHISVPAGFVFGLPVGLSFVGRAWSEAKLLNLAYAFEQACPCRQPPGFLPTANLGRIPK